MQANAASIESARAYRLAMDELKADSAMAATVAEARAGELEATLEEARADLAGAQRMADELQSKLREMEEVTYGRIPTS